MRSAPRTPSLPSTSIWSRITAAHLSQHYLVSKEQCKQYLKFVSIVKRGVDQGRRNKGQGTRVSRVRILKQKSPILIAACAIVALAGVQISHFAASGATASENCRPGDVHLQRGGEGGAGGTEGVPFLIQYSGSGSCTLDGYATMQFLNSTGKPITLRVYKENLTYY